MTKSKTALFESAHVLEAVVKLAFPTVIGQIILVVYNMADTFFISLTGSDAMISAVTVCMPAFMVLSAVSNLFGIVFFIWALSMIPAALTTGCSTLFIRKAARAAGIKA